MNRRIRFLKKNYPLVFSSPVLDVGCGDSVHLFDFPLGSVGMDGRTFEPRQGYEFIKWSFEEDISSTLQKNGQSSKFQYVWCNDVLEHSLAPHLLLLNLRRSLSDDGILFLGVPLVNFLAFPKFQTRGSVFNLFCGFKSQDHINFFTFSTLKHTAQYAGFEIDGWYSPFLSGKRPPMIGIEPVTLLALKKKPNFNYGPKAYKVLDNEGFLKWKDIIT